MSERSNEQTSPVSDAAKRRELEAELTRLGLSPTEVQRLLASPTPSSMPSVSTPSDSTPSSNPSSRTDAEAVVTHPAPARKDNLEASSSGVKLEDSSGRVTAASLEAFVAQKMAQKATAQLQAVRDHDLKLPEFRESTVQERLQAEPLLRDATMLRRRENFREAEQKLRAALELVPKDAAALEMLGDVMQSVGRVDEALAAYKRATQADPRRSSAEKKFADLLTQQQQYNMVGEDDIAPNAFAAVLLSALFPGFGHFLLREWTRGILFLLAGACCVWLLGWSPWGFGGSRAGISTELLLCCAFTGVIYIGALIDVNLLARQARKRLL